MKRFVLAIFILVQFTHASVEAVMYCDWQGMQSFQPLSCSDIIKIVCGNTIGSLRGMAALVNLASRPSKIPSHPAKYPAHHSGSPMAIVPAVRIGENSRNPFVAFNFFAPNAPSMVGALSRLPIGGFITLLAMCMFFLRLQLNAWLANLVFDRINKTSNIFPYRTLIAVNGIQGFNFHGGAL